MNSRPLSVTIVAWFLILSGIASLIDLFLAWNPAAARAVISHGALPLLLFAWSIAAALITIVCGLFILKGRNWARLLYVAVSLAGLAVAWLAMPAIWVLIAGALLLAVTAFFLFRGPADNFFGRSYFGASGDPLEE